MMREIPAYGHGCSATMKDDFTPPIPFRNPHVQTILSSSRLRALGAAALREMSVPVIIEVAQGTRLLGYHSQQSHHRRTHGLIALIHGWEGSSDSSYIISMANYLYQRGYDIFRLNLRDHGDSHHLNEGLFHGALTDETTMAVRKISQLAGERPFFLMGFSLGGNYALRVALRQRGDRIPNLRHIIAVSPALDPLKSTLAIDGTLALYRLYFLKKWKRSLQKKQSLYPHRYDFRTIMHHSTCMSLTEAIMPYYPEFTDYKSYFLKYTMLGDVFSSLSVPVTIIASQDDPVIPVRDFHELTPHPLLTLHLQRYGGHCGFFESFLLSCWHEKKTYEILQRYAASV
jgi:uncharacterized protein